MKKKITSEVTGIPMIPIANTTGAGIGGIVVKIPIGRLHVSGNEDFNKVVEKINEIVDKLNA